MKDSFGGAVMMGVALFFLAIFIVLIALTLQYAKAFKVKNHLIDYIEEIDGIGSSNVNDFKGEVYPYLKSLNVKPSDVTISKVDIGDGSSISKIKYNCYYKVEYVVDWEFPMFGISGKWHIAGETRNVTNCNTFVLKDEESDYPL